MIVNYGKVDNVIRNIIFTINALKTANNQLENEISRLLNCKGTEENPHNHSSEIASIRKTIDNNEEKIKKLEIICNGLSNFKSDVFKKDIDLSRLFENNDLLEKIMQKVIPPYKCPYEDEQMLTDDTGNVNIKDQNINLEKIKNINLVDGKEHLILCQNDTWNGGKTGWDGCYSESIDAMWRVNHTNNFLSVETHILNNSCEDGSLNGCEVVPGSTEINSRIYNGNILNGIDSEGNIYKALRIVDLSKKDFENITRYQLQNGKSFAYRVYNTPELKQSDGHTILCTGTNQKGEYLYSNCATRNENYKINKTLDDQYNNKKYYEREEKIEIIIDITE